MHTAATAAAPYGWSLGLHALLAAALLASGLLRPQAPAPQPVPPIAAAIVDQSILQAVAELRAAERRRAAAERGRQAAQRAAERAAAQAEARHEAQRKAVQAEARRKAELAAQQQVERQARLRAAEESRRSAAEARQRAEREAELQARLANEGQRTDAAASSLRTQYVAAIQAHVEQRWFRPPGLAAGTSCTVHVLQIPGGEVAGLRFGDCGGGEALRRSIESAVRNASPLPAPPEPALFEREVRLVFTPED
ncbi:MAG: cell envelope integrity protein TolA [Gammaproteobacteria bacterium]|nr:cell envelope integrity protein TolA [Gammaproteobacteria bacterium]